MKISTCKNLTLVIAFGLLCVCCLAFYSSMYLSSDVIIEEIGVRALYSRGFSAWHDLLFTFAPDFIPNYLVYYLIYPFFNNVMDKVFITSFLQVIIFVLACITVVQAVPNVQKRAAIILITLAMALYAYLSSIFPNIWIWYYSTNDNLGADLFPLN